ncbi:MAG: cob(I)yrinic acid a,c-diamide adenosyltransferase, partial [Candidatus Verstraetearchaeota archaeon]|nr:cob(I)yrinic acid a,c-diamide adenosyltransferase [Candidatus Verstraetearchaeota archaeon]
MKRLKPRVHVYTGEGEGKTIAAFGLALRAIGHGKRVLVVQFLKGRKDVGEYKVQEKLQPLLEVQQFGKPHFINLAEPSPEDKELAQRALEYAKRALQAAEKPNVLILDEVNLAAHIGLVSVKDVLALIESAPKDTTIVLTGRYAPKEFIERADLATEMRKLKHPFDKGISSERGLEY